MHVELVAVSRSTAADCRVFRIGAVPRSARDQTFYESLDCSNGHDQPQLPAHRFPISSAVMYIIFPEFSANARICLECNDLNGAAIPLMRGSFGNR